MKKFYLLLLSLLFTAVAFAQKKERVKGSKTVTVAQREVGVFETLEIEDNLQVYLVKGGTQGLEIEADDNLHEVIQSELNGTTLRLFTSKDISGAKNISVRVTYTNDLKTITARHETVLNALADLELDNITIKNFDFSKSYLNVNSGSFSLIMNDKTTAEVNVKAANTHVELSKDAKLKALIASPDLKLDMYQKATAVVEGDAAKAVIRIDNNAVFTGKRFTVKNMELVAEGYTTCSVMASETINIAASGKSEIQLLGTPKVTVQAFADNAILYKKEQ